ncbi:hypothetical protein BJY00DRAFT_62561 [Aspergillus carlsbadensis]|nr:hypothetical protein BJY00DRAFT_62561 [Aspergillus carlsbadensis]
MRLLVILSIACSASAWTFTWTNKDGQSYIEHSNDPEDCKGIKQAEGEKFRWVPEEDGLSIWLYENGKCQGGQAGYSPPTVWDHVSSRDLLSFRVGDGDGDDTSTNTTSTSTSTTTSTESTSSSTQSSESTTTADTTPTSTSSATETPSTEPSNADTDNSSSSAGPIAGGVVGGVAGLAAIGGLFFFLGRRRRSQHSQLEPRESGPDDLDRPGTAATAATATTTQAAAPPTPMYGGAAVAGSTQYDPTFVEGKPELDSAPVYQADNSAGQPLSDIKQGHSPFDDSATISHRPPARMMAELPGDNGMIEMSDSHRVNELQGDDGIPKKW